MKILMILLMSVFFFMGTQAIAEESVCDGQVGAAFGLCNAYCDAMDCDSEDAQASDKACDRVYNKFVNITGQEMPCEVAGQIDYSYLDDLFPEGCKQPGTYPELLGIPICDITCSTEVIPGIPYCAEDRSIQFLSCYDSPDTPTCGVHCQIVPDGYSPTTTLLPVCIQIQ